MRYPEKILLLGLAAACCAGCSSEFNLATGREETLLYGTEKEVKIGEAVALQVEKTYKVTDDPVLNARVERILERIAAVSDRRDIVYTIKILDKDDVNAVSLPGGYIYIFKGLIDKVKNDDQLAGVIAHEVGHITARHAMKRLQASYGYTLLQVIAVGSGSADAARGVNAIFTSLLFAHSRQDEFQSDRLAVKYLKKAGYDPREVITMLDILKEEQQKAALKPVSYFRTHPYIAERQAVVHKEVTGELDFRGYLNITGHEDEVLR